MRKMSLVNETLRLETETRPRRWENASRDRLETETSRPRLHPVISFRQISCRHWLVVSSCQGSTNAILSCTALQPAESGTWAAACSQHCRQHSCSARAKRTLYFHCSSISRPMSLSTRTKLAIGYWCSRSAVSRHLPIVPISAFSSPISHQSFSQFALLHNSCDVRSSTRLLSQTQLSTALFLTPGTLCRTLWQLLTHWHLWNLG